MRSKIRQMFYYQIVILEIIAEMEKPKEFPKANKIATAVVMLVYTVTAVVVYATYQGGDLNTLYSFRASTVVLLHPLQKHWVGRGAEFLLSCDLVGSSLVRFLILSRAVQLFVAPTHANEGGLRPRLEWLAISTAIVLAAGFLGMLIPDVHLFGRINGGLALLVCYIIPCTFFLVAQYRRRKVTIARGEQAFLVLVIILGAAGLIFYVGSMAAGYDEIACVMRYQVSLEGRLIERSIAR